MFKELNTLSIFFEDPEKEYHIREIARITKKAPATISTELKKYATQKIIQEKEERNHKLYKANTQEQKYKQIKKFYNNKKITESGIIGELNKQYLKPTIVLFGSYQKAEDNKESDIDLLIISEKTTTPKNMQTYEKKLKRKIQTFTAKKLKEIKNPHLINNIINGETIQGAITWN